MIFASNQKFSRVLRLLIEGFFSYKIHWLIFALMTFNVYQSFASGFSLFFEHGSMSSSSGALVGMDAQIQTSVAILAAWLLFSREIRLWYVPLFISIGIEVMDARIFEEFLHPLYMDLNLYPSFLVHEFKHEVNAAYARIYTGFWVGVALLLIVLVRRWRSLDRLFFVIIFWSVFATAGLFHWVTVKSLRVAFDADREHISMIAESPDVMFEPMCEYARTLCMRWDNGEAIPGSGDFRIDGVVKDLISTRPEGDDSGFTVSSWMSTLPVNRAPYAHPLAEGKSFLHDLGSFSVAVTRKRDGSYRAVANVTTFERTNNFSSSVFGYLALSAHVTWLFGGLYLLMWHKRRRARRARTSKGFGF